MSFIKKKKKKHQKFLFGCVEYLCGQMYFFNLFILCVCGPGVPLPVYLCVGLPGASVSFDHSMIKSFPEGFPKGSWQVCVVVVVVFLFKFVTH